MLGWNTKISARDTNYGARIDYVFVTAGLLPWIRGGDIQASVRGSDHCPIYIDLYDEITMPSGEIVLLREALGAGLDEKVNPRRDAPRLAAKHWVEYSAKQTLLHSFFNKPTMPTASIQSPSTSQCDSIECEPTATPSLPDSSSFHSHGPSENARSSSPSPPNIVPSKRKISSPPPSRASVATTTSKSKKLKPGQAKLSSFFSRHLPLPETPSSSSQKFVKATQATRRTLPTTTAPSNRVSSQSSEPTYYTLSDSDSADSPPHTTLPAADEHLESDYAYALSVSEAPPSPPSNKRCDSDDNKSSANSVTWAKMLAPLKPPCCTVHGEPTKELKVNKPGPNQNKRFFICSRYVSCFNFFHFRI